MEPLNFKQFILNEAMHIDGSTELQETLKKLPKRHRNLLKGYQFKFQAGHTLKNDDSHVGSNDLKKRIIVTSGPFYYPREFALLHEIGHTIWLHLMNDHLKKEWSKVVKKNPRRIKQSDEENFSMAYAACYCKHPPLTHHHEAWVSFIKRLPK